MLKIEYTLGVPRRMRRNRKRQRKAGAPAALPRITRLMALAIKLDGLMRGPEAMELSDIARLGHVSRARVTQIMNLLLLAPDLQERLLFLVRSDSGREPICESKIRQLTVEYDWQLQRARFNQIIG